MGCAIEIKNIKKYYRYGIRGVAIRALDGVSFSVGEGEVFGLIGPNGAGKSTAIKILLGLTKPNSGECRVFGEPLSTATKRLVGYLPETPYFYKFLTGLELVVFCARLCGMGRKPARAAAERALETVGLADAANRQLRLYSKGMVQRAALAQAIVHDPKIVILDEPASGLDPVGADAMAQTVMRLQSEGKTILMCSHAMNEVERLCSRAALLCGGKIAALGALGELLEIGGRTRLDIDGLAQGEISKVAEYAKSLGASRVRESAAKMPLEEFFRKTVEK
ncbi:MAG: ABC transporter ATP-binding protein [Opitutales bacterium]|nr:ABC transporter ATP-binding protein [Opitutales bacterium]